MGQCGQKEGEVCVYVCILEDWGEILENVGYMKIHPRTELPVLFETMARL